MAAGASTVRINFLGDSRSLSRATADARGEVDKFSKGISGAKKIFAGFALAGGVAGAFSFAKGLIADAAESAKVMRLTENVIRSTGGAAKVSAGQVADLATAISNKTGVDDEAIQSGQNLLLTFTNIKNTKTDKIFDQATKAAVDMTAALNNGDVSAEKIKGSSIMLGKALNDPVKGITALTRAGVTFTEAQKKQITEMVKAGDTAGAQKMILAELKKEFGGAAAAATSPAQKATVAWGNLREELGAYLLPIVAKVATFLTAKVIPAISQFVKNIKSGGGGFAAFRAGLANVFGFIQGTVLPLLQRFGTWFTSVGWPAIQRFAQAFWKNLQPALAQISVTFNTQLRPALEVMIAKFKEAWPTIQRVLTILGQVAGFILSRVVPVIVKLSGTHLAMMIKVLANVFAAAWKIIGVLLDVGEALGKTGAAVGRFVAKVAEMPGKAVKAIGNALGTLKQAGIDLVQGLINGIIEKAKDLPGVIKEHLVDAGKAALGKGWLWGSPSKVTTQYGQWLSEGLAGGIKDKSKAVVDAMKAITDKLQDKLSEVRDFAKDIRSAFTDTGNITGIDTALADGKDGGTASLLDGLRKKAADAQSFAKAMKSLRKQGLNQTTLDQLREAGPDGGLAAARNLLGGGMGGIDEVNRLMSEINRVGSAFAEGEARRQFGIGPNANLSAQQVKVALDVTGGEDEFKKWIRKWIRSEGGDPNRVLGAR